MKGSRKYLVVILVLGLLGAMAIPVFALTGAIYTTDITCGGVNVNHFAIKTDVYVNGGPAGGGSGLPDGEYYVQVTDPSGGTVLGTSVGSVVDETPVTVVGGAFVTCYRLWDIVYNGGNPGYADTPNNGGVYKVWVGADAAFADAKTDNFKVKASVTQQYQLDVLKFYDANANGANDDGQLITGWKVNILDIFGFNENAYTPVALQLDAGTYTVSEYMPLQTNWMATTPTSVAVTLPPPATVAFGNLCLGGGGGLTLGFWSNNNGKALFGADDLALMVSLNLRNANGTDFNPASYAAFRTWLLSANATNMAYMLSAQLAAMELNVLNVKVSGSALIYAPGTKSTNALGFATVNAVMAEANTELGLHGTAYAADAWRSYQEALKNALDKANNNLNFVQSGADKCPVPFPA